MGSAKNGHCRESGVFHAWKWTRDTDFCAPRGIGKAVLQDAGKGGFALSPIQIGVVFFRDWRKPGMNTDHSYA